MTEALLTLVVAALGLLVKRWVDKLSAQTEGQTLDIGALMAKKLEPIQSSVIDTHRHIGQLRSDMTDQRKVDRAEHKDLVEKVDQVITDVDLLKTKVAILETTGGMRGSDKRSAEDMHPQADKI